MSADYIFLIYIGVYINDEHPEDQALSERCCFSDLVEVSSLHVPVLTIKPWAWDSVMQVSKNTVVLSIVVTVLCYCRKVMYCVCYSLAAVAIGK